MKDAWLTDGPDWPDLEEEARGMNEMLFWPVPEGDRIIWTLDGTRQDGIVLLREPGADLAVGFISFKLALVYYSQWLNEGRSSLEKFQ